MYLIGGYDREIDRISDVWSSDDGITWTKDPNPPFKCRSEHQTIVFKNKIYVIAGMKSGGYSYEDIWNSSDGKEWKDGLVHSYSSKFSLPYLSKLSIPELQELKFTVKDVRKLKFTPSELRSSDFRRMASYTAAKFLLRGYHCIAVFRNKLYVIGREENARFVKNDVWSAADGVSWKEELSSVVRRKKEETRFSGRAKHSVVVFP